MKYRTKESKYYPEMDGEVTHPMLFAQHAKIMVPVMPLDVLIDLVIEEPREDGFGNIVMSIDYATKAVDWVMENSNLGVYEAEVQRFEEARYVLVRRTLRRISYEYPLLEEAVTMIVMERYQPTISKPIVMPEGFNAHKEHAMNTYGDGEWMLELLHLVLRENTDYPLFEGFNYSAAHLEIIRANCYRAIAPCFNYSLYRLAMAEADKVLGPARNPIRKI